LVAKERKRPSTRRDENEERKRYVKRRERWNRRGHLRKLFFGKQAQKWARSRAKEGEKEQGKKPMGKLESVFSGRKRGRGQFLAAKGKASRDGVLPRVRGPWHTSGGVMSKHWVKGEYRGL